MIICLDTETTGLYPEDGDEIIQLSIVQCDGDFVYDEYFCPVNSTDFPEASRVTGLYYDQPVPGRDTLLCDCPPISDPETHAYLQDLFDSSRVIVGYNLNYDLNMLEYAGFDFSNNILNDPMYDFRNYYIADTTPDFEQHREELTRYDRYGNAFYKTAKLIDAAEYLEYDPDFAKSAHNSLFDVQATIHVWERLAELGWCTDFDRNGLRYHKYKLPVGSV